MALSAKQIEGHQKQWGVLQSLLEKDHLSHGLAFVGPSGVGKRQMALALAEAAGCPNESILQIAPAGTMLKLEQAQEILSFLNLRSISKYRLIIVDDAQTMNASFANALLKILEEPPANTHFIFLLPALSQLLPTIRSRLQAVRFFPLANEILARHSNKEEWMVKAAQGSFARLEEWSSPDVADLKQKAVMALNDLLGRRRDGFESMSAEIKERESSELMSRLFQQFFRDALLLREKPDDVVHADCLEQLKPWAQLSKDQIICIWDEAFRLQQDIAANLDRGLLYERFFQRGRQILENQYAFMD